MLKRIIGIALIVIMAFTITAYGAGYSTKEVATSPKLSFSDGRAVCGININNSGKTIKATMRLYSGNAIAGTWTGEAKGSLTLSGKKVVVSGKRYTLKVTATVDGKSVTIPSVTKTAP